MSLSSRKCAYRPAAPLIAAIVVSLAGGGLAVDAFAAHAAATTGTFGAGAQQADVQQQARTAQRQYERARRRATAAGADSFAAEVVQRADANAARADDALGRGNFEQALAGYRLASSAIDEAVSRTSEAAEAARAEAEAASRAVVHSVASAEAELEKASNFARRGRFNDARLAYEAATSLYEAATGTERAMVDADVFAVLQKYEKAMESEDLEAFKSLWLDIDEVQEHRVQQSFEWFDSIQIEYSETNLVTLSDDTAVVTSVQRTQWVAAETGEAIATDNRVTFNLRKKNAAWLIESLRMEAVR